MKNIFKNKNNSMEEIFLEILHLNKENFYKIAYSYVKNQEDALDVIQESVCKGYTSLHKLRERKYMKTWFTRIVINTSITYINKRKNIIQFDEGILTEKIESSIQIENKIDVRNALDTLSDREKTIVILRFFEDKKIDEIARIVEQPINTTKTILYRALKKLKVNLEEVEIYE